jgi:hypothetical protein
VQNLLEALRIAEPCLKASLQRSDFVQQNEANYKLTKITKTMDCVIIVVVCTFE